MGFVSKREVGDSTDRSDGVSRLKNLGKDKDSKSFLRKNWKRSQALLLPF